MLFCVVLAASATLLELGPAPSGSRTVVECLELTDEKAAFTNFADRAETVAFSRLPRPHLLHSWKALGVTVLQRLTCAGSPNRFRREAGFLAFTGGADGIWLAEPVPPSHSNALAEARADWRLLAEVSALADEARRHPSPGIAVEERRVRFFLADTGFDWEDLDTLRWECHAWKHRLELLLGRPQDKREVLDNRSPPSPEPLAFAAKPRPFSLMPDRKTAPQRKASAEPGLSAVYDDRFFKLVYTSATALPTGRQLPGGHLDFTLQVADGRGELLPYRFHCDLEPMSPEGARAPARGRGSWLYGIDERFRPYSIAYGARNSRVTVFPRLADYGPDYPDPRPTFALKPLPDGRWQATLAVSWLALYGKWPMQTSGTDVWQAGVEGSGLKTPVSIEISWPRGNPSNYTRFAAAISTGELTQVYEEELRRTERTYSASYEERMYPFATPKAETFQRGEAAADRLFLERLVQPLLDRNANTWQAVRTDKDHRPTFDRLPPAAKQQAWRNLGKLLHLSHDVSRLRAGYLADRFAGRLPPPYERRDLSRATPPDEPDADFDESDIQLDEKEF